MTQSFEIELTVPKSAIDQMNHVNNVVYVQWIQDIAQQHWQSKTDTTMRSEFVWVVMDHFIAYHAPSFINDTLKLKTWIDHYQGAKCQRNTEITNLDTNKTIVTAKTHWCLLQSTSLRPTRITKEISSLF
ncbi:acyl-CoA thioesterase [Aquimarina sp. W85]|uniref:acyl-CoA thioesterase n=1 Tax=Aquimarina rhodophyticola TaxID=3342246 RepID=UPI00366E615E